MPAGGSGGGQLAMPLAFTVAAKHGSLRYGWQWHPSRHSRPDLDGDIHVPGWSSVAVSVSMIGRRAFEKSNYDVERPAGPTSAIMPSCKAPSKTLTIQRKSWFPHLPGL